MCERYKGASRADESRAQFPRRMNGGTINEFRVDICAANILSNFLDPATRSLLIELRRVPERFYAARVL